MLDISYLDKGTFSYQISNTQFGRKVHKIRFYVVEQFRQIVNYLVEPLIQTNHIKFNKKFLTL